LPDYPRLSRVAVCNSEGPSHGLKSLRFVTLERLSNALETLDGFERLQPFPTLQAYLRRDFHESGVWSDTQKLLNIFRYQLAAAYGVFLKRRRLLFPIPPI
jgi:hypothetical protein